MKKYELTELIKRWEREDVTIEQVVGQILLWLKEISERLSKVETAQQKKNKPASN